MFDASLDIDVHFDRLFSWVAVVLPQYTIPDLKRMSITKFMRLTHEAEEKQKRDAKNARHNSSRDPRRPDGSSR